jgi:hypothetical protein
MAAFVQYFQADGPDPEVIPHSPQLIEAETLEAAAELGRDSLISFLNEGVIHSFAVVGILEVANGEG